MKTPDPAQRAIAERLLLYERTAVVEGATDPTAAAVRVYEKIHARLSPLLGGAGVRALFAHSARLAAKDVPSLVGFSSGVADPQPEDQIVRLRDCMCGQGEARATEVAVALFATFIHLVGTFIGDGLTAKVLRGAWPELAESVLKEEPR